MIKKNYGKKKKIFIDRKKITLILKCNFYHEANMNILIINNKKVKKKKTYRYRKNITKILK